MNRTIHSILILLASLTLAACGGGGGGGGGGAPAGAGFSGLLVGNYDIYVFGGGHFAGADEVEVTVGDATADGVASLRVRGVENENGVLDSVDSEVVYEIFPDRTIELRTPLFSPDPLMRGAISADGDVAVLSSITALSGGWSSDPSIMILVRAGGSFTPGGLSGTFLTSDYSRNPWQMVSMAGRTTFAAGGDATFVSYGVNYEAATIDRTARTHRGSYGLSADGTFALSYGSAEMAGGLYRTGDLLITSGEVVAGHAPRIAISTRQGSGMSNGSVAGEYYIVGFSRVRGHPVFRSMFGTVNFDGAGAAALRYTMNEEGALSDRAYAGTYAVAPDGRLAFETITEKDMRGGVTPDGRFAHVGGGLRDSDNAAFYFMVRK